MRSEFLIPCGDWNGHVGRAGTEYREVHGGMGYGRSEPDVEGERILEYALAFDLLLGNTCFKKHDSHLITYKSGNAATQIDFILFPRAMRKLVTDVKVIPCEEVALQHQLLVCDMRFDVPPKTQAQVYAPPKSMEAHRPSKEKSLPGGFQVACECICRCSRCCH